MSVRRTLTLMIAGAAASAFVALHRLGLTAGSTRDERVEMMPGEDVVRDPQVVATHAATLPAPPDQVWPWLVQVGWHRGGWYTPRWVDVLLFPQNRPSADHVHAELQALSVGDVIPDGPPEAECGFIVREVVPAERLVLESTSHLPLAWRRSGRARLHWTWVFTLTPVDAGRSTRLVFRWRARTAPWWLTLAAHAFVVPADFVMSRGMLRGLRRRVSVPGSLPPGSHRHPHGAAQGSVGDP